MNETSTAVPTDRTPDHLLTLYQAAQENAHHHEVVMWTIVSVTWTANTLLLSFVLSKSERPLLLGVIIPLTGIVLTIFALHTWLIFRTLKNISYETCQKIEARDQFPVSIHLHTEIAKDYGCSKGAPYAVIVSVLFGLAWALVLLPVLCAYLHK